MYIYIQIIYIYKFQMEINILAQNLFRTFHQYAYNSLIRLFYFYLKFLDKYINIVIAYNLLYMCIYIYILYIYIYICVCVCVSAWYAHIYHYNYYSLHFSGRIALIECYQQICDLCKLVIFKEERHCKTCIIKWIFDISELFIQFNIYLPAMSR